MQTIVITTDVKGSITKQVFVDDFAGAAREVLYWESQHEIAKVEQFTETTDQAQ